MCCNDPTRLARVVKRIDHYLHDLQGVFSHRLPAAFGAGSRWEKLTTRSRVT
jgi:hypothetical protein